MSINADEAAGVGSVVAGIIALAIAGPLTASTWDEVTTAAANHAVTTGQLRALVICGGLTGALITMLLVSIISLLRILMR